MNLLQCNWIYVFLTAYLRYSWTEFVHLFSAFINPRKFFRRILGAANPVQKWYCGLFTVFKVVR